MLLSHSPHLKNGAAITQIIINFSLLLLTILSVTT